MKQIFTLLSLCFLTSLLSGQAAFQRSVMLEAKVNNNPPSIQIKWNQYADATNYVIYRRNKNAASWSTPVKTLTKTDTAWTDTNVEIGKAYEYRVLRNGTPYTAYGYIFAGIELQPEAYRGKVIVLVDSLLVPALDNEISQYLGDLRGEGWIPLYKVVPNNMPVTQVKSIIKEFYNLDPSKTRALFLIGHIPVPYSGDLNPDGHPDHLGAWPADGYYGDVNGDWTDEIINDAAASDPRNRNIPGDGKFDQTYFPTPVELEVGRVDFHDLPAFADDEVELVQKYFKKAHAFRTKAFSPMRRGLLQDNFGGYAEGFSQNGYKNFSAMFGIGKVDVKEYRNTLLNESYIWSYGCGGGNYVSASGINSSFNLATDSLQTVFTMLFGSYFGDWDSQNNFLRSALASGQTLSNAWAARPNWQFHHMALGETIGYAAKLAMNNNSSNYDPGYGSQFVHISLLGDPTLVQYPIRPMQNLAIAEMSGNVNLSWDAYTDNYDHYELFRRFSASDPFVLLKKLNAGTVSYVDSCVTKDKYVEYSIRASALESSASGTFYVLSQGAINSIVPTTESPVNLNVTYNIKNENVDFNASGNAKAYLWNFGDGNTSTEQSPDHSYSKSGTYKVILTTKFDCITKMDTFNISVILTNDKNINDLQIAKVYPVVVNQSITIENPNSNEIEYSIIAVDGKYIKNGVVGAGKTNLSISDLSPGLFQMKLDNAVYKFVVQR